MLSELDITRRWGRSTVVPVSECVHYCGFPYGAAVSPYEIFHRSMLSGERLTSAREQFSEFVRWYRPEHLGQALGIETEGKIALWNFPWARHRDYTIGSAWVDDPEQCGDVLTNFSNLGVAGFLITIEWFWLERILFLLRKNGYQPSMSGGGAVVRRLISSEGGIRYLVMDGNHRASALAALGHKEFHVRYLAMRDVRERDLLRWPAVRRGFISPADARAVFLAYFQGNRVPFRCASPATIYGPMDIKDASR